MGDVTFIQSIRILAGATPLMSGQPICDKDFVIDPLLTQCFADINEDDTIRFNIADGTNDQVICMGTVALGKILVITPEIDLQITLVNGSSTSPFLIRGGLTSILHTEFTGLLVTNNSGLVVKGKMFIAGD